MTSRTSQASHPILACVDTVSAAVKDVANVQPVFMTTPDKALALEQLAAVEAQVTELRLRVMATADDVADADGARDVAVWLGRATQADPRVARADLELARDLDKTCPMVAAGMRNGAVSPSQARVITAALEDPPSDLDPDTRRSAEETLVGYADRHRPSELRRIGRRILEVVAPEIAEAEEARLLDEQERRARAKASLRFRPLGDGTTRIIGLLPDHVAERLKTYLQAFSSPRHHSRGDNRQDPGPFGVPPGERTPQHHAQAHAFGALLEHLDPAQLPAHGGDATTVIVTIPLDHLTQALATAGILDADLTHGANLTAAQARRLACTAKIIPAVLGGNSEILDLGRTQRLFTPAQRKALRLRDRRCRAEGCTVPATWCEAHHRTPWSRGGNTDLADGVLLCSHHHHRAHDTTYTTNTLPNGDIRFHRRV